MGVAIRSLTRDKYCAYKQTSDPSVLHKKKWRQNVAIFRLYHESRLSMSLTHRDKYWCSTLVYYTKMATKCRYFSTISRITTQHDVCQRDIVRVYVTAV